MAISEITTAELTAYNTEGTVTADAIDTSDGNYVDISGLKDEKLLIRFYGGTGAGFTAVVASGDYPASGIGDLTVVVAAGVIKVVCLESARFKDDDEYIIMSASSTGTATAATVEVFSHA